MNLIRITFIPLLFLALTGYARKGKPYPVPDSNNHVNNGQYIQMALDYLPDGFDLRETRVEYREQTFLGDVIHPLVVREEEIVTVSLRKENEKVCAIVRFSQKG